MKFLLEQNLYKTARWLRFSGCDVRVIEGAVRKPDIVSHRSSIFITTSDRWKATLDSLGMTYLVVPRENWEMQLCLIIKHFNIPTVLRFDRCSRCGSALERVSPEEVKNRVPDKTFEYIREYYRCNACDKFYWAGTHHERIEKRLQEILGMCG